MNLPVVGAIRDYAQSPNLTESALLFRMRERRPDTVFDLADV